MNKEFKIGVLVFIVFTILIIGLSYLKGLSIFKKNTVYYSIYEDIGGLEVGSSIMINGYKVGMVSDIKLINNKQKNLFVTLNLEKDVLLPNNTVARIINQDLMGTKSVALLLGNANENLESGDTLISSVEASLQEEVNAQILPLKNKAEQLISSVDSVVMVISAVLNKETRDNLSNSLGSLDQTFLLLSQTIEKVDRLVSDNDDRVSKIIENFESISSNIKQSNGEVINILTNFSDISDSLRQANIGKILKDLSDITDQINSRNSSLGLMLNDDNIYTNLEKSTEELAELIEDIKLNPSRYIKLSILGGSTPYEKKR